MGNYTISESIKAMDRPKMTVLKLNKKNNRVYVYEYKKIKENNKWRNVYGKVLGYMDEDKGFISNSKSIGKTEETCFDFGSYALVYFLCDDLLSELNKFFNEDDALRLFILASIHFVNGYLPMRYLPDRFKSSMFYIINPNLKLGESAIRSIYNNLGKKTNNIIAFQKELINKSSKKLAIDGHVISSHSDNNELCHLGYKASQYKYGQINVLMAYDIESDLPLLSKTYEGSLKDNRSIIDLFKIYHFENTLFIVDKGFYSLENIKMFSSENNKYIIPIQENTKNYNKLTEDFTLDYQEHSFLYKEGNSNRTIVYKEQVYDNNRCFIFRDIDENAKECCDYKSKIGLKESYTVEKYTQYKDSFGTLFLQTNLDSEAKEIFIKYKKRWKIGTFNNTFKYRLDVNKLDLQNYYEIEGLSFIMLLSSIMDSTLRSKIKGITEIKDLETLKEMAAYVKIQKIYGKYQVSNLVTKRQVIFDKLGLTLEKMNELLNKNTQ